MKRFISFIMVTLLTVVSAFANIAEGVSGDCTWVIDNDGNLSISSESDDAADLGSWVGDSAPWSNYKESITTVVFSSPVNAKTCAYMFKGCKNLNAVYLDKLYTNNVTDMSYMFADCASLEVIEFSMAMSAQDDMLLEKGIFASSRDNFLTGSVTNMAGMFEGCKSLHSFYLQNLDVHSVTNFSDMFAGCSSLENMNLTGFAVNKNANVSDMFRNCTKLMNISSKSLFPSEIEDETFMSLPTRGICNVELPTDCVCDYQTASGWRHLFVSGGAEMKSNGSSLTAINSFE